MLSHMHELGIAQNILEIVQQAVPKEQTAAVRSIRIRVGPLSGVVPDSLEFCFGAIVEGTPLGQARLQIEETAVQTECAACGNTLPVEGIAFACPGCGSAEIKLVSGTELQVVEIELADLKAELT